MLKIGAIVVIAYTAGIIAFLAALCLRDTRNDLRRRLTDAPNTLAHTELTRPEA